MPDTSPTVEQVAQKVFQAQGPYMVPNPFALDAVLDFVQDVGAQKVLAHFEEIMARLSWGPWLDEVAAEIKKR